MQCESHARGVQFCLRHKLSVRLQVGWHRVISSASWQAACYGCRQMGPAHLASGPGMVQRTCSREVRGDLARSKGAQQDHGECCNQVTMVGSPTSQLLTHSRACSQPLTRCMTTPSLPPSPVSC